jgi:hypothetical protein
MVKFRFPYLFFNFLPFCRAVGRASLHPPFAQRRSRNIKLNSNVASSKHAGFLRMSYIGDSITPFLLMISPS